MQQLTPWIQSRFYYKNSALPLSGGFLIFYYANTTNFAPTFQSKNGSMHPNPVPLDIIGGAEIWLSESIIYDVEIRDSNGALQETRKGISASSEGGGGGGGLEFVSTSNSESISLGGLGTEINPLTANALISSITANALGITTGGLYVADLSEAVAEKLSEVKHEDSLSISLEGLGTDASPITSNLIISNKSDNAIEVKPSGTEQVAVKTFVGDGTSGLSGYVKSSTPVILGGIFSATFNFVVTSQSIPTGTASSSLIAISGSTNNPIPFLVYVRPDKKIQLTVLDNSNNMKSVITVNAITFDTEYQLYISADVANNQKPIIHLNGVELSTVYLTNDTTSGVFYQAPSPSLLVGINYSSGIASNPLTGSVYEVYFSDSVLAIDEGTTKENATGQEHFTQVAPDSLAVDWFGNAAQGNNSIDSTYTSGTYVADLSEAIAEKLSVVSTTDTVTANLSGDGKISTPIQVDVQVSTDVNNLLKTDVTGLLVDSDDVSSTVNTTDSNTIDFSGDGSTGTPLTGDVILNNNPSNIISSSGSGLLGAVNWGDIGGSLSNQSDLEAELNSLDVDIATNTTDIATNTNSIASKLDKVTTTAQSVASPVNFVEKITVARLIQGGVADDLSTGIQSTSGKFTGILGSESGARSAKFFPDVNYGLELKGDSSWQSGMRFIQNGSNPIQWNMGAFGGGDNFYLGRENIGYSMIIDGVTGTPDFKYGIITALPTGTQVGLVGYDSAGKLIQGTGGSSKKRMSASWSANQGDSFFGISTYKLPRAGTAQSTDNGSTEGCFKPPFNCTVDSWDFCAGAYSGGFVASLVIYNITDATTTATLKAGVLVNDSGTSSVALLSTKIYTVRISITTAGNFSRPSATLNILED